jgi:energy-coupling factor transporter ATP-binding protein EcfA2/energy-coupling factor transporter transmembrane protein EcfT
MSITVEQLSVTPVGAARPVLNRVTFRANSGERILLLGPSGSGKSTLLLTLSGVLNQLETAEVQGSLSVDGSGLLLQNYSDATIAESVHRDVAFGAESAGASVATISELVNFALAEVGLGHIGLDRNPATLSGGELQRMCLAGLLTLRPQVLLLDEPTAQLDAESAREVRTAVADYLDASGATLVLAEHLFEPWLPLVDRVVVLSQAGELLADGPSERVFAEHSDELAGWGLWLGAVGESKVDQNENAGRARVTALVGPSGAGKSTRLRVELAKFGKSAGWLPQNPALALTETSVLGCLTQRTDATQAQRLLDLLGLSHLGPKSPHEISGGEQRRLALAVAVAGAPEALFLDEPTVGLDRHSWQRVVDLIFAERERGAQVLLATHDAQLLTRVDAVEAVEPITGSSARAETKPKSPFTPIGLILTGLVSLIGALQFHAVTGALVALGLELISLLTLTAVYPQLRKPRLIIPIAIGVASVGFSNWWLSDAHSVSTSALIAIRVAFFGLPGLLFAAAVSPSVLGDQLGQILRLPARPVVAAMVGLNRVWQLQATWGNLKLVRGVHGVAKRGARELVIIMAHTLVAATRSAEVAAIAMESRGFSNTDASGRLLKRTWAVLARWGRGDLWLILGAVAITAVGVAWR